MAVVVVGIVVITRPDSGVSGTASRPVVADGTVVRRALAAGLSGGGVVNLPAGTYDVGDLTIPDGVAVTGNGAATTWLKGRITVGSHTKLARLKLGIAGAALKFSAGATHTRFDEVAFTGGGPMSEDGCVVQLVGRGASFLTFHDCIIGANPYDGNGVSITTTGWSGGDYHDIAWDGCRFLGSPRMDFECTQRRQAQPVTLGYHDIDLADCIFEPSGSECISYDDATGAGAGHSTISGCTIKGAGWNQAYEWHQGVEFNRVKGMRFIDNTVYTCVGDMINHTGLGPGVPCDVVYSDNTFDRTRSFMSAAAGDDTSVIYYDGVSGASFEENVVRSDSGSLMLGMVGSTDNTFARDTWTDSRAAALAGPCVLAIEGSSRNEWTDERFDSASANGICRFETGSTDNALTRCTFVTHGSVAVVVAPGLTVLQTHSVIQ